MIFERLQEYTPDDVARIIKKNDVNKIKLLPLSIGEYAIDLMYAQNICIYLCETFSDEEIRANAILGLSYIARRFGILNKKVVPYLEREFKHNKKHQERVRYAIEDIELFTDELIKIGCS